MTCHQQSTIVDRQSTVESAVRRLWGFELLRPMQREVMAALLAGRDSISIMPTGSGKSLCFQAPALIEEGVTVVVCPLIALMHDQVNRLKLHGVAAVYINSEQHPREHRQLMRAVKLDAVKLLYISPERLLSPEFVAQLSECKVAAFVIDECHCVVEWGYDFRPAYAELKNLRLLWPDVPIHAFTATATHNSVAAIARVLGLKDNRAVHVGTFDRPNLYLRIRERGPSCYEHGTVANAVMAIAGSQAKGYAGIVYAMTRADTETLTEFLRERNINAAFYHAGMEDSDRWDVEARFFSGEISVIVATVAFGMGIDHPHVRFVVHASMPSSLERYHQEIGRAGRDGASALCVLFWDRGDIVRWRDIFEHAADHQVVDGGKLRALAEIDEFCRNDTICRHRRLLGHFGETADAHCGNCDNCEAPGTNVAPPSPRQST